MHIIINNKKSIIMKSTIIFLGLIVFPFATTKAANVFKSQDLDQQELSTLNLENPQPEYQLVSINQKTASNTDEDNTNDTIIFNPSSVINSNKTKLIEEVIAENQLITVTPMENFLPLSIERTIEDYISEENKIIESNISNEVYPLDFKKINPSVKSKKTKIV